MSSKKVVTESFVEHPFEKIFDLEPCSTVSREVTVVTDPLVEPEEYDDKDKEIEQQFQEVYTSAMEAYVVGMDSIDDIEPKFRSRIVETSSQMLTIALNAAKEKAAMKKHKDDLGVKKQEVGKDNNTTNNTLIVADRNEMLKMLMNGKKSGV